MGKQFYLGPQKSVLGRPTKKLCLTYTFNTIGISMCSIYTFNTLGI